MDKSVEMGTEFYIWDEKNIIKEMYSKENIVIVNKEGCSKRYILFFSSNGLYFPNTIETFTERIINQNRYEWQNVTRGAKKLECFEKIIYIRDLYKTWYVKGVSDSINSIERLTEELRVLCKDATEIITVGNSAGGYIATLMGIKLGASAVFNFSGQYDITHAVKENPFWTEYRKENGDKYLNLCTLIKDSNVPVFYFYPGRCEQDLKQYEYVKDITNVYPFALDRESHGSTVLPMNYQYLFTMNIEWLKFISKKKKGKLINQKVFLVETAGLLHAAIDYINFRIGRSNYNNNAHL